MVHTSHSGEGNRNKGTCFRLLPPGVVIMGELIIGRGVSLNSRIPFPFISCIFVFGGGSMLNGKAALIGAMEGGAMTGSLDSVDEGGIFDFGGDDSSWITAIRGVVVVSKALPFVVDVVEEGTTK